MIELNLWELSIQKGVFHNIKNAEEQSDCKTFLSSSSEKFKIYLRRQWELFPSRQWECYNYFLIYEFQLHRNKWQLLDVKSYVQIQKS